MSKSHGTKDTQGVNGDAANLQRQLDAAAATVTGGASINGPLQPPPCPYQGHRATDWLGVDVGLVVCGTCHPPAIPAEQVVRRGEPGFTAEQRRRAERIVEEADRGWS